MHMMEVPANTSRLMASREAQIAIATIPNVGTR
jgi:hypothetical protein